MLLSLHPLLFCRLFSLVFFFCSLFLLFFGATVCFFLLSVCGVCRKSSRAQLWEVWAGVDPVRHQFVIEATF